MRNSKKNFTTMTVEYDEIIVETKPFLMVKFLKNGNELYFVQTETILENGSSFSIKGMNGTITEDVYFEKPAP